MTNFIIGVARADAFVSSTIQRTIVYLSRQSMNEWVSDDWTKHLPTKYVNV